MKKILVPIDFSECSLHAAKFAINLAKLTGRELLVLHSIQVPAIAGEGTETNQEIEQEVSEDLVAFEAQLPELSDVKYNFQLSYDFLLTSIRKLGKKIDFIVMGTTGATGAKEVFLGSNAYDVIKEIDIPVFAIPLSADSTAVSPMAFASDYKSIRNYKDLDLMIELVKRRNSELHILHIGSQNNITREELEAGKSQEQFFKSIRHSYHFIQGNDITEEIGRYIVGNNIQLLTLYARKHTLKEEILHKSITKEMAFHAQVPMLILPETN